MTVTLDQLKAASSEQLLTLIKRRHPCYEENSEHWNFVESCYTGGRKWIKENIFTYHKEGRQEYAARLKRAFRFPHSREVVNLVNKYVFKGAIERAEDAPSHVKEFWGSATFMKRPVEDLMGLISLWSSTFGRLWVVVDNNLPADVESEADRKISGGRSYAYFLKPTLVYDLAYDDDGELLWMLHGETRRDDTNPLTSTGEQKQRYRLWTKEFTAVIDEIVNNGEKTAKLDLSSVRLHGLGLVPIFAGDHNASEEPYVSPGLIDDVSYLDRAVANYLSNLDVIIQDQTFSQLAIPFQGLLPFDRHGEDGDDETDHLQQMGTRRVFAYNAEGGSAPTYISPDVKQADIIMRTVTKIVGEIYHSIGASGERTKEDNSAGIDNSSGVAKAYDFEKLNAMLASKARALENIEKNIVRILNAWAGDVRELEDTDAWVSYPSTFDVRNLADELDTAQRLALGSAPKTVRREQMKRTASKMFPQASETVMKKMHKEIDNDWLVEPVMDPLGQPPASPKPGAKTPPNNPGGTEPEKQAPRGRKGNRQGENNTPARKDV